MICINCVTPPSLKRFVAESEKQGTCHYCGKVDAAVERDVLFDYILDRVVENTASEEDLSPFELGMLYEGGADDIPVADLGIVLDEWLDLGDEPYNEDLYEHAPEGLKLNDRGMERHYFGDEGLLEKNFYDQRWDAFVLALKHTHRFFNPDAKNFLDDVFAFLANVGNQLDPECIREIRKGEPLYRSRTAASYEDARSMAESPATQLGLAPKNRVSSQRMTPAGIAALYCALERETCLSEIRAITGDKVVSIAMTPTRHLTLLDLTKLNLVDAPDLTLLDKGCRNALHLKAFVASLVARMSKPQRRNDDLSYLSTQVVFEYLRLRFGDQVDGLVFPSVQTGGKGTNVVLFPESSLVSAKNYKAELARGEEPAENEPHDEGARLFCVSGSARFHSITAIETKAKEYSHAGALFMSNLSRQRLGIR